MTEPPPYTGKQTPAAQKPAAKNPPKNPPTKPAAKNPPNKPAAATTPPPPAASDLVDTTAPDSPAAAAAAAPAVAPVVPGPPPGYTVVWHSRAVLIGVAGAALLAAILTAVGSANFPSAAPVEQLYAFGLIVDLIAVIVAVGALIIVEFVRRANPHRVAAPVSARPSVFAIISIVMAAIAFLGFATAGGGEQLAYLVQGIRGRYMYWTGALFVAGIPWALAAIFGAWGFRPRGHLVTNILAAVSVVVWLLLAALTTTAALIYGAGLSD